MLSSLEEEEMGEWCVDCVIDQLQIVSDSANRKMKSQGQKAHRGIIHDMQQPREYKPPKTPREVLVDCEKSRYALILHRALHVQYFLIHRNGKGQVICPSLTARMRHVPPSDYVQNSYYKEFRRHTLVVISDSDGQLRFDKAGLLELSEIYKGHNTYVRTNLINRLLVYAADELKKVKDEITCPINTNPGKDHVTD